MHPMRTALLRHSGVCLIKWKQKQRKFVQIVCIERTHFGPTEFHQTRMHSQRFQLLNLQAGWLAVRCACVWDDNPNCIILCGFLLQFPWLSSNVRFQIFIFARLRMAHWPLDALLLPLKLTKTNTKAYICISPLHCRAKIKELIRIFFLFLS